MEEKKLRQGGMTAEEQGAKTAGERDAKIAEKQDAKTAGEETVRENAHQKPAVSETWAEETIADLDEFIESQGIYIRQ